ncbi:MAG: cupredoxin family copper-binding protein, partial [Methanothrix sp.]|nr:cupredoxin family copper-binding protein [Methanothrix sp.]
MLLILTAGISGCVEKTPRYTNSVEIKNFSFQPSSITVSPGTMVTWVNNDPMGHTVSSSGETFNSGNMATGDMFNFTYSIPGSYQYQCLIHPSMVGYVIVTSGKDAAMTNATRLGSTEMKDVGNNKTNQSAPVVGLKLVASGFAAPMEFIGSKDG